MSSDYYGETLMSTSDYGEPRSSDESWSSLDDWSWWSSTGSWKSEDTDDDDAHSDHNWVLLNRSCPRLHSCPGGDRATAAFSRTSRGKAITVSFDLVDPPGTSVLTVGCPKTSSANVVAAHRDVVLLTITSKLDNRHDHRLHDDEVVVDLFVYHASSRDHDDHWIRRPSLSLLPSKGRPVIYSDAEDMGIISCTSNDDDESFVVAYLEMFPRTNDARVHMFRSGSDKWETFEDLHVRGANGGRDLRWWSTDAVVPYGRRCMMWVDYYRGMVVMDLSSSSSTTSPPRLRYVPLPVDTVGDPVDVEFGGRGFPKASRRVCVTRYGVKFVSVDSQHWSNFGVGHQYVLKWNHRFRVTTWWLRDDDDGWWWRRDVTMHEDEFWDVFHGGRRYPFPHVQPEFPVVDLDNPDVVVFRMKKSGSRRRDEERWMIKVDLRRKVLLAATVYSKESDGLSSNNARAAINSARMESDFDPIPSELPRYLDDAQACKKRMRQY